MTPTPNPTMTAQATLLYGATGTYKTTQVGYFSEYIAEITGAKRTRVVSAETAGAEPLAPYIETGAVEVLWLSRDMSPRSALRKIGRGEWPKMDANGIPIRVNGKLQWETRIPEDIGGYAFEGLTSFADLIGQELKSMFATGAAVKDAKEGTGLAGAGYSDNDETFGSGSQSQVGGVQDSIMELIREAPKNLYAKSQGRIVHCLFTAHEAKGTDDMTGQSIYGPGTIGKAITGKLFKEFGSALHLEQETVAGTPAQGGKPAQLATTKVWGYYRKHPDSENPMVKWDAKPRIPAIQEAHEMLEKEFPGGKIEFTFKRTLKDYLKFQDSVHELAMKILAERRAKLMAEIQKTSNTLGSGDQSRAGAQVLPPPHALVPNQVSTAAPKPQAPAIATQGSKQAVTANDKQ